MFGRYTQTFLFSLRIWEYTLSAFPMTNWLPVCARLAKEKRMPNKKKEKYFMADSFRNIKRALGYTVSNVNNLGLWP
jgi:hypothetical protein